VSQPSTRPHWPRLSPPLCPIEKVAAVVVVVVVAAVVVAVAAVVEEEEAAVTAAAAETDMAHRPARTTASSWRTSPAAAAGRTSRYGVRKDVCH